MKKASLNEDLEYGENKPVVSILLKTEFTKEIRVVFKENQIMKEHKTPFPIVVEVFDGAIDFGVFGTVYHLQRGDMINLEGGVPHDLVALKNSIVRLTLSTLDQSRRVKKVVSE